MLISYKPRHNYEHKAAKTVKKTPAFKSCVNFYVFLFHVRLAAFEESRGFDVKRNVKPNYESKKMRRLLSADQNVGCIKCQ